MALRIPCKSVPNSVIVVQLAEKAMKKRAAVESNPPNRYLIYLTKTQPFLSPLCFE
jgi:hypothetical protein